MSTPEQPNTPPLTRKQLREMRNTGATPIVMTDSAPAEPAETVSAPAPLPRPAEPASVPPEPVADSAVDLDAVPLTRRQARQQERIRTASVPVITPELAAAHAASIAAVPRIAAVPGAAESADDEAEELRRMFASAGDEEPAETAAEEPDVVDEPADEVALDEVVAEAEPDDTTDLDGTSEVDEDAVLESDPSGAAAEPVEQATDDGVSPERVVNPALGAAVIAGEPVQIDLPPSFDQLLARGATGAIGTPNALILSQTTGELPMVAPVTATGDVLVTGTFTLPEGLGSTGHARGTADGKEIDAVLVDGELPAHSSPTPIAASAAVSTVKPAGEVIRPPVPEKGSRLMMWLAITAGVLALALAGVLILALVTGLF